MAEEKIKYFIFSLTQMQKLKLVERKLGRTYVAPTVIVSGTAKMYTSIIDSMNNIIYSDSKLLVSGALSKLKYTK